MNKSSAEKLQEWKQRGISINDQFSLAQNINLISCNSSSSSLSKILSLNDMDFLFLENFVAGIKSEWSVIVGDWQHNSEFNAYQISGTAKNKTKVDITTPDDVLVECKIIKVSTLQNTYLDLVNRYSFDSNSGYSIAYVEVYSRLFDLALILFPWNNNSRGEGLVYKTWTELGLSGVTDLEGKVIGIKCEGNVIKGYLDGIEILSVVDDSYSSGQTGLIANPGIETFIFDNFKITSIGE